MIFTYLFRQIICRQYHGTTMATEIDFATSAVTEVPWPRYYRDHGSEQKNRLLPLPRKWKNKYTSNGLELQMIRAFAAKNFLKKNLLPWHFRGDGNEQKNRSTAIAAVVPRPRKRCNFTSVATEMTW